MQINFGFPLTPGPRSKTLCMSKSEPRPGHADQFWFSTNARAPLKNPFACPSLNPDQDTQINFGFPRAPGPRSKTLCMSRSEPRPGHADQFWFFHGRPGPAQKPFACPSLSPDQDTQINFGFPRAPGPPLKNPLHVRGLNPDQDMQINFGFPRAPGPRSKTLCMSKSEPRPGHANFLALTTEFLQVGFISKSKNQDMQNSPAHCILHVRV